MTDFKEQFEQLKNEQAALNERMKKAKAEAVKHIQEIILQFNISTKDLNLNESGEVRRTRAPSAPKYRTPDGSIEWSGKGLIKDELKVWLEENGKTLDDIRVR